MHAGHCPILGTVGLHAIIQARTGQSWEATNHALRWERLLLVLEGAYDLWLGDRLVRVTAGSLVWQHPGEQVWQRGVPGPDSAFCLLNGASDGSIGRVIARQPSRIVRADLAPVGALIGEFLGELGRGSDRVVLGGLLTAIARLTVRALGDEAVPLELARTWDLVAADPARAWSVAGLARRFGASSETLRKLTRRHFRRSARAHLAWLRLRHAADLLTEGELTVGMAAIRCGYRDAFAFSRAFRRQFGVAPSQWSGRRTAS